MNHIQIPARKTPHRLHFIVEWASKSNMKQKDIVRETGIDKGTVSRWFSGSLPKDEHLDILALLFKTDVHGLFRHPDDDHLAKLWRRANRSQRAKAMKMLEVFFEDDRASGTDG